MNNSDQGKANNPEVVEEKQKKASTNTENLQLKLNTFRRKPKNPSAQRSFISRNGQSSNKLCSNKLLEH